MPGKLLAQSVRYDIRSEEMRAVMLAFLDLLAGRVHLIGEYRRHGAKGTTFLDTVIALYVFVFREHGTRQSNVVEWLDGARWTIRDSLARLERNGVIIRDDDGRYYPTEFMTKIANGQADRAINHVGSLCEAVSEYRKKHGG